MREPLSVGQSSCIYYICPVSLTGTHPHDAAATGVGPGGTVTYRTSSTAAYVNMEFT
jgi:hypothetical protein